MRNGKIKKGLEHALESLSVLERRYSEKESEKIIDPILNYIWDITLYAITGEDFDTFLKNCEKEGGTELACKAEKVYDYLFYPPYNVRKVKKYIRDLYFELYSLRCENDK